MHSLRLQAWYELLSLPHATTSEKIERSISIVRESLSGLPFPCENDILIDKTPFGRTRAGGEAFLYSIQNDRGMRAVVTNYGAIPVSLLVPCADGTTRDVVLGYDTLAEYEAGGFFGAAYGRRSALCLETEYYPDRIHHPAFPQPVFAAGEPYRAENVYRFSTP